MTSYRAGTTKRERRTRERVHQLDNQIFDVLAKDSPQSVRHVFYRMTDPRLPEPVEKSERGYRHVQNRCVEMRRGGHLPYGWIVDSTRRGYFVQTYGSAADFITRVSGLYRADLWEQSDYRCEIWVESRSIAGVVQGLCRELAVSLYPAGGFSSLTLAYESAQQINAAHTGKPMVVFYVGDYDPAGVIIDVSIERELRQHLLSEIELEFIRVGITKDQIETYDLPIKPRKESDRRAQHITHTVEAEAMPANILRSLLRSRIEALLPEQALLVTRTAEASERTYLRLLAKTMHRGKTESEDKTP